MYWQAPDAKKLAAFGLTAEDVMPDPVEVWPENWAAVRLFSRCGGQWRYAGMNNCATGLDYALPLKLIDKMNLTDKGYESMLDALNTMEMAALSAMREVD